jgi:hypothetical protein
MIKPSISFQEDGTMKRFGFGGNGDTSVTLFPFWMIVIVLPVIVFFFFSLLSGWSMPSK